MKTSLIFILSIFILVMTVTNVAAVEMINSDPAPVRAGRYAEITIVTRIPDVLDSPREDITYKIRETEHIRPVSGQEFTVARANPGQVITRTFTVYFSEKIATGFYPVELVEIRNDVESRRRFDVFVEGRPDVPELKIGSTSSIPNRLIRDTEDNVLHLELMNLGEKTAELVSAEIAATEEISETSFGSLKDHASSIADGQSARFEFEFDIQDTDKERIETSLDVSYRMRVDNSYEVVDVQLPLEIRLARTPQFVITSMEPLNEFRIGGSDREMLVEIKNTGDRDGENVRMRLFPNPESPFDFERTTIFVTSLIKPDESTLVKVPFDILDDALVQPYNINIELESVIGANRYNQRDRLEIDVTSEAATEVASYASMIVVGAIVLSLTIGLMRRRKAKSKKR